MSANEQKVLRFQDYTLDLRRGSLYRADHEIELRPKSFALLRYLVENAGRLASKDELVEAVWGNVAVSDVSLARCVSDVRIALEDQAQKIIKTLPRRGYLFSLSVSEAINADLPQVLDAHIAKPGSDAAARRRDSVETRQLTALACELTGLAASTANNLEDLRAATTLCHGHCAEVIARHHGHLVRYSANSFLAYFGYPQASEQDAENAMRAALALQHLAGDLRSQIGELHLCIGIASGLVAIEEGSAGTTVEQTAIGEPLVVAERLKALAEPDQILIGKAVQRLAGGLFEYRDLGCFALKGSAALIDVVQVLAESAVESRFDAYRPPHLPPLVGREEELQLLLRCWRQATIGEGSVALVTGEPGIGKSRVTHAMLELLSGEPHEGLRLFCSPHHRNSALSPFINLIERIAGFQRLDNNEQRLDKLEAALGFATTRCGNVVPLIADLLAVGTDSRYSKPELTPERRKEQIFESLLAYLEGFASAKPLLIVVEDLHWADPTSLELLDFIVERAARLRLLLVATFRPEFEPLWSGRSQTTTITLGRLRERQCAEIVANITRDVSLPRSIVDDIVDRADGIPLFVEELTKAVLENGASAEANDCFAGSSLALQIPMTLHSSLLSRLDRLGPAREIAQVGAALGRSFSYQLIGAVTTLPKERLDDALTRLVEAELIWRRGQPPKVEYTFKHALVQDVAYSTLMRDARRDLHARIAYVLDSNFSDVFETRPELLAHHYTEAGFIAKAARLWSEAGDLSLKRSALKEAAAQLTRALVQMDALPSTRELRREQVKAQIALANALMHTKGYAAPETKAALDSARALIERVEALGEPPEDPLLLISVLHGFWVANHVAFNGEAIRGLASELMTLAESQNKTFPLVLAHRVMGTSLLFLGDPEQGRAHLDQAMTLYNPLEHRPLGTRFGQEAGVAVLSNRPLALWLLGHPDAAVKEADEALVYARDLGQTASYLYAETRMAWFHLVVGNYVSAQAQVKELMTLAKEMEGSYWTAAGLMLQGCLFALAGDRSRGIAMIRDGIAASRLKGSNLLRMPWYLSCMARAHAELGQHVEAWRRIDDAIEAMRITEETWQEPDLYRIVGDLALKSTPPDEAKAQAYFERALAVARQQKAKSWELQVATRLAQLWRAKGERNRAVDLLQPIYNEFTEGLETCDLRQAKALLSDLTAQDSLQQ
jgi:DNA-binding winged helix-turn-helix (wHTH) protein/tetratricopeptide (TPR) repeat protein